MSRICDNGYQYTIRMGIAAVRELGNGIGYGDGSREENLARLKQELETADAVVIGAGSGLSTAAGFTYGGERFERYFFDFHDRFGITDMYSGGFYPFPDDETRWAWWARHIYYNRYIDDPKPVYSDLLELVQGKEYFVITTNVDHRFQRAGFDKARLFYTQGDYGLFQDARGIRNVTWDNESWVMRAMEAEGFVRDENGVFQVPEDRSISMRLPSELIPSAPEGGAVAMNLRADDTFVQDEGWDRAYDRYVQWCEEHSGQKVVYLEIGVGGNTPVIIKYPFWQMVAQNPQGFYAQVNYGEVIAPTEIADRTMLIDGDAAKVLAAVKALK